MTTTLRLPALYDKQSDAIFADQRYAIIEASTKSGKTVGCIIWLLTEAWRAGNDGRNYWWVAPVYKQASIAFRRLKRMLKRADPRGIHHQVNETRMTIYLTDAGSTLWFLSADRPDDLYGEDVYGAVMDEASRCRQEAWFALRSTLTYTRGKVRLIGNVKGRKNWTYAIARKAEAGEPGWHYARLTIHDAIAGGVLSQDDLDEAKRDFPETEFRRLYLAEPADDEGNPFGGPEKIRACVRPLSNDPVSCWGGDLAKSVNWTVLMGMDAHNVVAQFHRFQADWHGTKMRIRSLVRDLPAQIDATGVGDPIVEDLQHDCPQLEGFVFTSRSKQQLMESLASAIHDQRIGYPDGPIVHELESFEYEYRPSGVRYSAPEGMHDDCVCGLALGNEASRRGQGALALAVHSDRAEYDDDDDDDDDDWVEIRL